MNESFYSDYLALLPRDLKESNSRYIRWQDRHCHLFGKLLLIQALKTHNIVADIGTYVKYGAFKRPHLTLPDIDFNISHSGNFVMCAIGKNTRLGIDIEENKNLDLKNFQNVMSSDQWVEINNATYPLKEFYKFWTIKESVIKADGRGFSIPLEKLSVKDNTVQYDDKVWFVQELQIANGYNAALATSRFSDYKIHKVDFYESMFVQEFCLR